MIRRATVADAPGIARVHVDSWYETYPGLLPQAVIESRTYERRTRQWIDTFTAGEAGVFVAESGGAIVGFACGGPSRAEPDEVEEIRAFPGELYAIYLLRAYQGFGAGKALHDAVASRLRAMNLAPFFLWVLDANPSCAFYERLGGALILTRATEIDGAPTRERAYAWP